MEHKMLDPQKKILRYSIVGFAFIVISIVLCCYYGLNETYNNSKKESTRAVENTLLIEQQKMGAIIKSYGQWNLAYDHIIPSINKDWIFENIYKDVKTNHDISFVGIFQDDSELSVLYTSDNKWVPENRPAPIFITPLIISGKNNIDKKKQYSSFVFNNNILYLATVTRLEKTPFSMDDKHPFMVFLKPINKTLLQHISFASSIPSISFVKVLKNEDLGANIPLKGEKDKIFGYLTWSIWENLRSDLLVFLPLFFVLIGLFSLFCLLSYQYVIKSIKNYNNVAGQLVQTSQALDLAKKNVQFSKKEKHNFLSTMSHEIRTPMTGLIGMVELLKETKLNETQNSYVNTMENSSNALIKLVDNILEFSKLESDEVSLLIGDVNIRQLVDEIHGLLLPISLQKNIKFDVVFHDTVPLIIRTDGVRLRQILLHLVSNALKFTKVGSVKVNVTGTDLIDNRVELGIQVIDTGVGIPEGIKESLFSDFFQTTSTPPVEQKGVGLGLSIVKNLVTLMQGKLGVESKLGQGSVFWIQLEVEAVQRLKKMDKMEAAKSASEITEKKSWGKKQSFLIVDQNERNLAYNLLVKNGNHVANVVKTSDGATLLSKQDYDAVIIHIPGDAVSLEHLSVVPLRDVLTKNKKNKVIPIVAITDTDHDEFDLSQFDIVIHSPLTSNKLRDALSKE